MEGGNMHCIMHINKLKSNADFSAAFKHNFRIEKVENADPDKAYLNKDIVKISGTYLEDVNKRIKEANVTRVRKDSVKAYEIMLTFSHGSEDNLNIEKWQQAQKEWLENTFNVAPDGKSNIISVKYHGDETTPHIHAIVVPIDERGELCASSFTKTRTMYRNLQNNYRNVMAKFGFEKEAPRSKAKHRDIKEFYSALNETALKKLPELLPGETAVQYKERADKAFEVEKAHFLQEKLDFESREGARNAELAERINSLEMEKKDWEGIERELDACGGKDAAMIKLQEMLDIEAGMNELDEENMAIMTESLNTVKELGREKRRKDAEKDEKDIGSATEKENFLDDTEL